MKDGIIVGSDYMQEWLLQWWWTNYTKHNSYDVAFVDFGLSHAMKNWCKERGQLLELPAAGFFVKDREEIDQKLTKKWERRHGDTIWNYRHAWFKKPFACLHSPFERTIWIDLDCEILGSLQDLFERCEYTSGISLARDKKAPAPRYPIYNSGVIVFKRPIKLIEEWATQSLERNSEFMGDQDLLSKIIFEKNITISELPAIYNWSYFNGPSPEVKICHWLCDQGKNLLRSRLILEQL